MNYLNKVEEILNLAREKKLTISTAESCTAGLVSSYLTDVSGSSDVFRGSHVVYCDYAKAKLLKIDPFVLKEKTAVSREVAYYMAQNSREIFNTDLSISLTGRAQEDGKLFIGVANSKGVINIHEFSFKEGSRIERKQKFAEKALDLLYKELIHWDH